MEQLLDLYGFINVVLQVVELTARTALLGGVAFWLLVAMPLAPLMPPGDAAVLRGLARRLVLWGAAAGCLATLATAGLGLGALAATLEAPFGVLLGADFVFAAGLALLAQLALLLLALPGARPDPVRQAALGIAALALLGAVTAGSHALAREEERALLLAATASHQAGAALWIGGLPALLGALRRLTPISARVVGRRYSSLAAGGVGLILLGILGFWRGYIGEVEAVYGTAYGAMSGTKAVMLVLLLGLGGANFLFLHHLQTAPEGLLRVRRFVESEMLIGLAMLAVAASLTSVPPAADLTEDRVTWGEIVARFTPQWPRLTSPSHSDLAIPALQAQLDAEWQQRQAAQRPQAFTPGEGLLPPRNAGDIAWSEYNHHWAGILVLLVGLAALLDASGRVPVARHWPLLFIGLAGFILLRSDPEAWPLGDIGLLESLRDPEVVQHKIAALLVVGFAIAEWWVRLGRVTGGLRFVFPGAMVAGGVLLLAHTHAISNQKEALLVELSHLPLAVLAVVGGCARFTELRGPERLAKVARWIWPAALVLIGLLLLLYREA
ncbi:copper resistance protein [Siccirubricoccus sp. KC 17139]|uniref:Copper resistance protein n=1 Tax=Siccirubricoccus soli TaxID=2899147 RepID=A0ABT1D088_9PROT|nr:CopD family protein [Siccirubricoccus soli]MCO6415333.1 copper resistance protein [Siccirubricoccus soli]MCP2681465.1 copper resistance protein [Siccirubricoccus soli]